jgi:hypothetical protein
MNSLNKKLKQIEQGCKFYYSEPINDTNYKDKMITTKCREFDLCKDCIKQKRFLEEVIKPIKKHKCNMQNSYHNCCLFIKELLGDDKN